MKKVMLISLLVLAAVLWLAACGPTPTPPPTVAPVPTDTPIPPTKAPAAPTEAPTKAPAAPTEAPTEAPVAAVFPKVKPSAVRGQAIFAANCVGCHGEKGDGSGLAGAANFTDVVFVRKETPAEFFEVVSGGRGAMPAWKDKLSEEERWDALFYAWSFSTRPEKVATGQAIFEANCAGCHGVKGDGSGRPGAANFTDLEFMAEEPPAEFFEVVSEGKGAMPAWKDRLSEDERWDVLDYVRTFSYEYPQPVAAAPTEAPTATEPASSLPTTPDPAVGQQVWGTKRCPGCHGDSAEGGFGPKLAGTGLSFDAVLGRVRTGKAPMPAFTEAEVSDGELQHIYAWLTSLRPPTPTPPSQARYDTTAVRAMWEKVDATKVHSDYAKDAPLDFDGRRGRVQQALDNARAALPLAEQAKAAINDAGIQATIDQCVGFVQQIITHAEAALNASAEQELLVHAAEMVRLSRLDAWPLAIQAVRDAGDTGTVVVRVVDQAGQPIPGALVTVLTAHLPVGAVADASGQVTIPNVAAIPALQIKAYQAGVVYHEVHANVSRGGTAQAAIALPGPSAAGQVPSVSAAAITPTAGPGNGQVTLFMTATDPQGKPNLAEDQMFGLSPDAGLGYVLRDAGGDNWQSTVALPGLSPGPHTFYFFAVDHQCNTSNVMEVVYNVP